MINLPDVQRHSVDGYGRQDICYNDPEGEFVYYEDYCALRQELDSLRAEVQRINATAQPVSDGWVKCSEMMPEADGHYLVFANASTLDGYCDHNDIACYQDGKWSNEFNWLVTHWMPLPAAPGGQDA